MEACVWLHQFDLRIYDFFQNLDQTKTAKTVRRASWIRCHEQFVKDKRGLYNDICLIKFSDEVRCNWKTRPICLADELPQPGQKCSVAGFGDLNGLDQYSETLKTGILTVQNHNYCRIIYGNKGNLLDESFFCAANKSHGIDTCQGGARNHY